MPSRIMHLIIANRIKERFKSSDSFVLGNLLPDAYENSFEAKALSHFMLAEADRELKRFIDYSKFAAKYKEQFSNEIIVSYFCHLIADDLWLGALYSEYNKKINEVGLDEFAKKGYRDYGRLNYIFIDKYNLSNEIKDIDFNDIRNIEEINYSLIKPILDELNVDFCGRDIDGLELEVLDIKFIEEYLDKCVEVCIDKIEEMGSF